MNISRGLIVFFLLLNTLISCQTEKKVKFRKYMVAGERLYAVNCANCHQKDGNGFKKLYPPMNSEFMTKQFARSICIIKYGSNDSLVIDGVAYNQPMPAVHLTNLELAEISTYIYNKWTDRKGIIDVREFTQVLDSCKFH